MTRSQRIKRQWLRALRGNEYKQGRDTLRYTDSEGETTHCCLGVLCEIVAKNPTVPADVRLAAKESLGKIGELPSEVCYLLGTSPNPSTGIKDHTQGDITLTLAEMNDNGFTFAQIADVIETRINFYGEQQ